MSRDFKNCLDKKKLYRSDAAKTLAGKEFTSAGDDLAVLKKDLIDRSLAILYNYAWKRAWARVEGDHYDKNDP